MPFIKGHKALPGAGRPKRADEQVLVDLWNEVGKEVFEEAVRAKKDWAIKILMNKLFADQKETRVGGNLDLVINLEKKISEIVNE